MAQSTGRITLYFEDEEVTGFCLNGGKKQELPEDFWDPDVHNPVFKCGKQNKNFYLLKEKFRFSKVPQNILNFYKSNNLEGLLEFSKNNRSQQNMEMTNTDNMGNNDALLEIIKTLQNQISGLLENKNNQMPKIDMPNFTGNSSDPKSWMHLYELMCKNNNCDQDKLKILGMQPHLTNTAKSWFNDRILEEKPFNWEEWKIDFIHSFCENPINLFEKAFRYEYRNGPLLNYFYEKQRLMKIGFPDLNEKTLILGVIQGLPIDLRKQIQNIQVVATKSELMKGLQTLQPITSTFKPNENTFKPNEKPLYRNLKNLIIEKKNTVIDDNRVVESYFESMFIPNTDTGHNQRSRQTKVPLVKLEINGYNMDCFLDSGSDLNIIKTNIAAKLNLKISKQVTIIQGIGGKQTCNFTAQIAFRLNDIQVDDTAVLLDNLPYDLIVGRETMAQLKLIWNFHTGSLHCLNAKSSMNPKEFSKETILKSFPGLLPQKCLMNPKKEVNFELKNNHKIIQCKPYTTGEKKREWISQKIKEMIDRGIITKSESKFASPCVVVSKANGNFRLCQDYRRLNEETILDPYPFPRIEQIINKFGGSKFFTKIDLKDGFWQVGLTPETRKFTAFVTTDGHFEYTRLPFGWKNSPAKFQRFMDNILTDLLEERIIVYIDDICIGGYTKQECENLTFRVLRKLQDYGLKINPDKCEFCVEKIELLGRVIDGDTKRMRQEVVRKMLNIKRPFDLKSLQCFTGLTGHFRNYILNYAKIIRPLDLLKQKDKPFIWSKECEESFDTLVKAITSDPILRIPDERLDYELTTDASYYGAGGILYQRDPERPKNVQLRVVGYYSYTFTKAEQNYSVTEKECLAVLKSVKHFKPYIEGKTFIVHTDHRALSQLLSSGDLRDRLARWQLFLRTFEMKINHRSGQELKDADAISRLCIETPSDLKQTFWTCLMNQSLTRRFDGRYEVSDKETIKAILKLYHDDPNSGGHDGFWRTYYKIKGRFFWKMMRKDISDYISSCPTCQNVKFKFKPKPFFMNLPDQSREPMSTVHVDFAELCKKSDTNQATKSFIVVVDEATRFVCTKALKQNSKAVIRYLSQNDNLKNIKTIISDRGRCFMSKEFQEWAEEKGIKLKHTTPYHPAGNGLAERTVRDLKTFLQCYQTFPGGWRMALAAAAFHHNSSFNEYVGCTPHFKLFKTSPHLKADKELGISTTITEIPKTETQQMLYRKRMQEQKNKSRRKPPSLQVGDLILIRCQKIGSGFQQKGPFPISQIKYMNGHATYVHFRDRNKVDQAHISNIVKYHSRSNDYSKSGRL